MNVTSDREQSKTDRPKTVIRPATGALHLPIREVFRYRALISSMVQRKVRLNYRDLSLGFLWVVARPLLMVVVFIFIRNISQASFGIEIPYALYLYSGLILWFYFLQAATQSSSELQANAGLAQKVYYPHLVNPIIPVLSGTFDLAIAIVPLIAMMIWFEVYPGWKVLLLPLVILQCMLLALGIGLLFAVLRLNSRDWERFLALLMYIGLFLSPVIYSPSIIPERVLAVYHANPMSGTLLTFRAALFDDAALPLDAFVYSCAFTVVLLFVGLYCFGRAQKYLLDNL